MESSFESVAANNSGSASDSDGETESSDSARARTGESPHPYQSSSAPQLEEIGQLVDDVGEGDVGPNFGAAIVTVFDIKCSEMRMYLALLDHPSTTISDLAEVLDRSESNVYNRLTSLREKGLVTRDRQPVETGGDVYYYTAQPLEETTEWMQEHIEEWSERFDAQMHHLIDAYQ